MKKPLADRLKDSFPDTMPLPAEFEWLADWYEEHGKPINRHFRITAHKRSDLEAWFGGAASPKIGPLFVFGRGVDGSMFALWQTANTGSAIVHLGSEGDGLAVLATEAADFLRLLAMGYDPLGFADTSKAPDDEVLTPSFKNWVTNGLHLHLPKTGDEIVLAAQEKHGDFEKWIKD